MTPLKDATRWKNDRVAGAEGGRLSPPGLHTVTTRDPDVVREWAAQWFEHFELHDLAFVFEEEDAAQIAARAYELWSARAGGHGYDRDDWFEAQRELRQRRVDPSSTSLRYRLVKTGTVT